MPKRHPGISIFWFSIPVMFAFVVGLRVTQHGGASMLLMGRFYLGCYCVAALSLLMLTSLGGLREYFRARYTHIPAGIGPFWLGLGSVMIVMVLAGALTLPMPENPPLAIVGQRTLDPWNRADQFQPMPVVSTAAEQLEQTQFVRYVSYGALGCFALLFAYGALRAISAAAVAVARQRHRYPRFVVRFLNFLDKLLQRITNLPTLPSLPKRKRVSRHFATCTKFRNPMGDTARNYSPNDCIEISYHALCALADDLGVPRAPGQTPYEFLDEFPRELGALRREAAELTEMYVAAAYSPETFTDRNLDRLRKFWQKYERVRSQVVV